MAALLGVSLKYFDGYIRPAIPDAMTQRNGKRIVFDGPAVTSWYRSWARPVGRPAAVDLDGDGMTGGDSPALEEWRRARARLAELDLRERVGTLIRRESAMGMMLRIAQRLKSANEKILKKHGADSLAYKEIQSAMRDIERDVRHGQKGGGSHAEN